MPVKNQNKKTAKEQAILLIQNSLLIPDEKKEEFVARVGNFKDEQLEKLIEKLEREAEFITEGLKETFHKLGAAGDEEGLRKCRVVFEAAERGQRQAKEGASKQEEAEELSDLEDQINEL